MKSFSIPTTGSNRRAARGADALETRAAVSNYNLAEFGLFQLEIRKARAERFNLPRLKSSGVLGGIRGPTLFN